jgi:hypothetical protein
MSSIVKAFSDLLGSVFEVFTSIINTIFSAIQSVFAMAGSLLNEFAHLFGGTIEFLLCICPIPAQIPPKDTKNCHSKHLHAYTLYAQRQSKPIGAKKTA